LGERLQSKYSQNAGPKSRARVSRGETVGLGAGGVAHAGGTWKPVQRRASGEVDRDGCAGALVAAEAEVPASVAVGTGIGSLLVDMAAVFAVEVGTAAGAVAAARAALPFD